VVDGERNRDVHLKIWQTIRGINRRAARRKKTVGICLGPTGKAPFEERGIHDKIFDRSVEEGNLEIKGSRDISNKRRKKIKNGNQESEGKAEEQDKENVRIILIGCWKERENREREVGKVN